MSSPTREATGQPDEEPRRDTGRVESQQRQREQQEHIRELVDALGDPNHPLHSQAINDLVDIGPAAVSALTAALAPTYPWLTSYRAAEALAQIGDGRAGGALIGALRHPNSNVRWSVVRALSEIGDTRALIALRRIGSDDHGKTSWGESVSDTAQMALDRLQSRSALLRFSEPIKTALVFAAMLAVLAFATNRVQALRSQLQDTDSPPAVVVVDETATAVAQQAADASAAPTPTAEPTTEPTPVPITAAVITPANIRSGPGTTFAVVGNVQPGDELVVIAESNGWYRVQLPDDGGNGNNGDDEGFISKSLVEAPSASVPADGD